MEKFEFKKRKIIITASLKGPYKTLDFSFLLDTGAGTTVINDSVASALGYDMRKIHTSQTFVTAGGRINAKMIQLHKIAVLGKQIPNFTVCVIPLPFQILAYANGLIGVDFLQQLKKLKIDFETKEIGYYS